MQLGDRRFAWGKALASITETVPPEISLVAEDYLIWEEVPALAFCYYFKISELVNLKREKIYFS